jgi:hypothetical protein
MPDAPSPIKISDVLRFLQAKGAKLKCDYCGGKKFDFFDEEAKQVRFALLGFRFPGRNLRTTAQMDLILLSCNNCAGVKFFMRTPVAQWAATIRSH